MMNLGTKTLLALAVCVCGALAQAAPIPFGNRTANLTVREQPIAGFLQDLFGSLDVPVTVSPSVAGAVNGSFKGQAESIYKDIAKVFNLVDYYDGAVLHIYAPQDLTTRTIPLSSAVAQRVISAAREMQLPDARNNLRSTAEGTLIVNGSKRFVEQIEEITKAQVVADKTRLPLSIKVFYLRYAWAQDVTLNLANRQMTLPGVASTVRAMLTARAQSSIVVNSYEQSMPSTAARMRGGNGSRQGTLGVVDADPRMASGPVLEAAYGPGGPAAAASGGVVNPFTAAPGKTMAVYLSNPAGQALTMGDPDQVRVEADPRLNAVIVRDAPERMAQYEQLIASLDIEPQAIEIEATLIDINTDKMAELGVNWRLTQGRGSLLFGSGNDSDKLLTGATAVDAITPVGEGGYVSAVLGDSRQFIARIKALQQQGAAKVVSSPQVLTLSNVEAVFDNSQSFYVRVAGKEDVDLFNVSAGTVLRVTPHVFKDQGAVRIKMLVALEDGNLTSRTVDTLPVVERSSINTQALIFEGESMLVGGITRESSGDDTTKVPVLGDIPVLGNLFKYSRTSTSRVERMFLITPRLASNKRSAASGSTTQKDR
jgi:type III secretion protein C